MLSIKDPTSTVEIDVARGEATRSYLYSPHLLYSPHILYPSGYLYGIFPIGGDSYGIKAQPLTENMVPDFTNLDILPKVDNIDIRP